MKRIKNKDWFALIKTLIIMLARSRIILSRKNMTLKLLAIGGLGNMLAPSAFHLQDKKIASYLRILDQGKSGKQRDQRRQAWKKHGARLVGNYHELIDDGDFDGVVICAGKNGDDFLIMKQLLPLMISSAQKNNRQYFILHLSTLSCHFVQNADHYCKKNHLHYANYPLTGGAKGAETGQMLILASGDRAFYERMLPMLQQIGSPRYFGPEVTQATAVKLIGHVLVFHGLLGVSLATVLHKNVFSLPHLSQNQVDFFDFLNQGAGGSRQWDVAVRQGLAEDDWDKGFLIRHAVIDALYTADLLLQKNLPRTMILSLLELVLLFAYLLQDEKNYDLATQSVVKLLANQSPKNLDDYFQTHLSWDMEKSLRNCVAALPEKIKNALMLDGIEF